MERENDTRPTLWSLRPAGEHAALRRGAQAAGLRLRSLSLQRLVGRPEPAMLATALEAPIRLYTSPAAVRFASRLAGWTRRPGIDIGVGGGTASALRRAGIAAPLQPERMDSEGVLALPALQHIAGQSVGLITAPGGRGVLPAALEARGARVIRADVYARRALHGGARRRADFAHDARAVLLVSSAEALASLDGRLSANAVDVDRAFRHRPIVVSSERLAQQAKQAGFTRVLVAAGPGADALIAAAVAVGLYNGAAAAGRAPL